MPCWLQQPVTCTDRHTGTGTRAMWRGCMWPQKQDSRFFHWKICHCLIADAHTEMNMFHLRATGKKVREDQLVLPASAVCSGFRLQVFSCTFGVQKAMAAMGTFPSEIQMCTKSTFVHCQGESQAEDGPMTRSVSCPAIMTDVETPLWPQAHPPMANSSFDDGDGRSSSLSSPHNVGSQTNSPCNHAGGVIGIAVPIVLVSPVVVPVIPQQACQMFETLSMQQAWMPPVELGLSEPAGRVLDHSIHSMVPMPASSSQAAQAARSASAEQGSRAPGTDERREFGYGFPPRLPRAST